MNYRIKTHLTLYMPARNNQSVSLKTPVYLPACSSCSLLGLLGEQPPAWRPSTQNFGVPRIDIPS